jgi:hypothetical protein
MGIEQTLQNKIEESKRWLEIEKDDSTYKRDVVKRIELINWVLEKVAEVQKYISPYYDASRHVIEKSIKDKNDKQKESESISIV